MRVLQKDAAEKEGSDTCRVGGDTRLRLSTTADELHGGDNGGRGRARHGGKVFMFYEMAGAVTEEGGAAHTINLCKKCHKQRRLKQGEAEVAASKWRAPVRAEVFPRQVMGSVWSGTAPAKNVRTFHNQKVWVRTVLADSENVSRLGTDGRWQNESPVQGRARDVAAQH